MDRGFQLHSAPVEGVAAVLLAEEVVRVAGAVEGLIGGSVAGRRLALGPHLRARQGRAGVGRVHEAVLAARGGHGAGGGCSLPHFADAIRLGDAGLGPLLLRCRPLLHDRREHVGRHNAVDRMSVGHEVSSLP